MSNGNWKWDTRFIQLAEHIAGWSKDPSTKVGAVIVDDKKRIVGIGFNGFPRGVPDYKDHYDNKEEKYKRVVHAELNAILNAVKSVEGHTLYVTPLAPCCECTKAIIQSGIKRIVYKIKEDPNPKWVEDWKVAYRMLQTAGVTVEMAP